jgi:hypothetical protein
MKIGKETSMRLEKKKPSLRERALFEDKIMEFLTLTDYSASYNHALLQETHVTSWLFFKNFFVVESQK